MDDKTNGHTDARGMDFKVYNSEQELRTGKATPLQDFRPIPGIDYSFSDE